MPPEFWGKMRQQGRGIHKKENDFAKASCPQGGTFSTLTRFQRIGPLDLAPGKTSLWALVSSHDNKPLYWVQQLVLEAGNDPRFR